MASSSINAIGSTGLQQLLGALKSVREAGSGKWEAHCPAHDDNRSSLSICRATDNVTLIHCHAGCDTDKVLAAVGMKIGDLFPARGDRGDRQSTIVATYDYRDADGTLILQAVRYEPKSFRQRRPKDGGGWTWASKGCKVVPYRLPAVVEADANTPVYIVEGEKDADRLADKGLVATCNAGGAGKWRVAHAKYLAGRPVVIVPDNDEAGRDHATKVAKSLDGLAASTKILALPDLPPKGDVSDWLDAGGTIERFLELAGEASEWTPGEAATGNSPSSDSSEGFVKTIADLICAENHFAKDGAGKLHRYSGGVYRSKAESYVRASVKSLCVTLNATEKWSSRFASEVVEWILVDAPELWERPPINVVNVHNGLLRLVDGVLLPHSPDHLSPIQIPVKFDPAAICPAIDEFVGQVFPRDAAALAYEVPAWLITPDTSIQKAVLLLGAGGNGKSTWLAMLVAFLGKANCTGLSLHKIEANRFAVSRLVGKLANVCPDLPTEHLAGTSMFKALTGGDFNLESEQKFKDGVSFDPYARLVFSANSAPRSADASEAFFDRWLVVPFDARFRGTDREITRKELDARLAAPAELSGLLNRAVAAWQAIQKRGGRLSEPQSVREAWAEFHAMTDPLSVWLVQYTVDDPQAVVPRQVLRAAYGAACERAGRPSLTDTAFGLALNKARPDVKTTQRTMNGRRHWVYVGIGMAGDDSTAAYSAQGAQSCPPLLLTQAREENQRCKGVDIEEQQVGANPVHPVHPVHDEWGKTTNSPTAEIRSRAPANGSQFGQGDCPPLDNLCPKCGHGETRDVPIHGGESLRRDCARCGRFIDFVTWSTKSAEGVG
ncbi:MAG: phage/plasmid primase, P4 family [Pirellulales bacterium]